MLGIELEQTRVYQEAKAEGETIGEAKGLERGLQQERALVVRLLTKKLGNLPPKIQIRINELPIDRVESLLDFTSIADLEAWLSQN
jgi:predicted transposase YdaD